MIIIVNWNINAAMLRFMQILVCLHICTVVEGSCNSRE